jgi:hypothetical protein
VQRKWPLSTKYAKIIPTSFPISPKCSPSFFQLKKEKRKRKISNWPHVAAIGGGRPSPSSHPQMANFKNK